MKKNINKQEREHFEKRFANLRDVLGEIIDKKEVDLSAFESSMLQSEYSEEFLRNLSSPETMRANTDFVKKAFEEMDSSSLMSHIAHKEQRNKHLRLQFKVIASVAASAILAFFVFNIFNTKPVDKPEIIAVNMNRISEPTLIVGEEKIITFKDKTINSLEAKSVKYDKAIAEINPMQKLIVPTGNVFTVKLSDGTIVTMNSNSELIYPTRFNGESRLVKLKGEAFFHVSKDTAPFIITTSDVNVKVYGTKFNVKNIDNKIIETVLVEGSVGVNIGGQEEVMMTPNQLVSYDVASDSISIEEVNTAFYTQWIDGDFNYKNYPLRSVIHDLESWYGVEIVSSIDLDNINVTFFSKKENNIYDVVNVIELTNDIMFIKEESNKYTIIKK